MAKKDIRALFAGHDVGKLVREAATDLYQRSLLHGEARDRKLAEHAYTSQPELAVLVSQVSANPPMWRMRTVAPLLTEYGHAEVCEPDVRHLEPELRVLTARMLARYGYAPDLETAREMAAAMRIHVMDVIPLRDSQRNESEYKRS